jgi:hypothetical protein
MGAGAKKLVVTDEWRNCSAEERLEHALVKVTKTRVKKLSICMVLITTLDRAFL